MKPEKIGQTEFDPRNTYDRDDMPTAQCTIGNDGDTNEKLLQIRLGTEDHDLAVRKARGIIERWQSGPNALVPVIKLADVVKDLEAKGQKNERN